MRSALGALRQNPHISSDASGVYLRSVGRSRPANPQVVGLRPSPRSWASRPPPPSAPSRWPSRTRRRSRH